MILMAPVQDSDAAASPRVSTLVKSGFLALALLTMLAMALMLTAIGVLVGLQLVRWNQNPFALAVFTVYVSGAVLGPLKVWARLSERSTSVRLVAAFSANIILNVLLSPIAIAAMAI